VKREKGPEEGLCAAYSPLNVQKVRNQQDTNCPPTVKRKRGQGGLGATVLQGKRHHSAQHAPLNTPGRTGTTLRSMLPHT